MEKYDLLVIGSGPAGEKAAVKAAYFGYRVAIIERHENLGGAGLYTGTIPSKALKETALHLSGQYESSLFGSEPRENQDLRMKDFVFRKKLLSTSLSEEVKENLEQHKVEVIHGEASFKNANTLKIKQEGQTKEVCGDFILIATGSRPHHPENVVFDQKIIHDSTSILEIEKFPASICIIGAGVIGVEFATIFATIGAKVYLVNDKPEILPFLDKEIANHFIEQMQKKQIELCFGDTVANISVQKEGQGSVTVDLKSGKKIDAEMMLFATSRYGNAKSLNCEHLGVVIKEEEHIEVNEEFRTNIPHIFACGDVVGFPSLASTSTEQGRVAVSHMFHTQDLEYIPKVFPYGMYTIPEISKVGLTEEQAKEKKIEYLVGKAHYPNMARGKIMGSECGFLKLIFEKVSLKIIGVHLIGPIATEIIHYGLSLVEDEKTLSYVIGQVFNYPTLHDLYKYAAYDGLGNLTGHKLRNPQSSYRK